MPIRPRTPMRQAQPSLLRHWTLWVWFAVALVLCLAGVSLWKSGRWLVHEDKIEKVGWGVVLAGESRDCERSDAAIRMFQEGKLDTLIISACRVYKTRYASEFMVDYYVQQGVPRERVFEFRQDAYSTIEEARLLIRQFRLQNLDTVVIVTTSFHTARTRRIFRKLAGGYPVVLVAAAEYNVYDPNAFWSNRESLKLWFDEWAKTFFTVFELAKSGPESDKAQFQGLTPDTSSSVSSDGPGLPEEAPAADSLHANADSTMAGTTGGTGGVSAVASGDSAKGAAALEGKLEAKTALDSAVSAKADSIQNRKDSIKAHKDSINSLKAKAAEDKAPAKEPEAKKSLPKAVKKPATTSTKSDSKSDSKDSKKASSTKDAAKSSDKKPDKTRPKK